MSEFRAYAVFCDDVRREDSKKEMYIGVYGHELKYESSPADEPIFVEIVVRMYGSPDKIVGPLTARVLVNNVEKIKHVVEKEKVVSVTQEHFGNLKNSIETAARYGADADFHLGVMKIQMGVDVDDPLSLIQVQVNPGTGFVPAGSLLLRSVAA